VADQEVADLAGVDVARELLDGQQRAAAVAGQHQHGLRTFGDQRRRLRGRDARKAVERPAAMRP
jgi:hypothetical protein